MTKNKKATVVDIARELGVAHSTVSRALADSPLISEGTKRRVREVADRLHYSHNTFAQGLRSGKTKIIELIYFTAASHLYNDPILLMVLDSMTIEFEAIGYNIMLNIIKGEFQTQDIRSKLEKGLVDGTIIVTNKPIPQRYRHHLDPTRCVIMDNQLPGYSSVNFDTDNDFSVLFEYLIGQGCRTVVGFSADPEDAYTTRQRIFSFEKIAQTYQHEIRCLGIYHQKNGDDAQNGRVLEQLNTLHPEAIINMSTSALEFLAESRSRKGDQQLKPNIRLVAIVESDESQDDFSSIPRIRRDFAELVRQSALCLTRQLEGTEFRPVSLLVQNPLILPA